MPASESPPEKPPRFGPNRLARLVRIAETDVGKGVFARRTMEAEVVIGEIFGEHLAESPEDPSYVMELPSCKLLEPDPPLRFLNHSCDPNCEIFYYEAGEGEVQEDRLWLQTIRPIKAGEQLLIDYGWPADAAIECRCGAADCRGWICDLDELHLLKKRKRKRK